MTSLLSHRVLPLREKYQGTGPVLYWMNREIRTGDNWSMIFASTYAQKYEKPLIVCYNLDPCFLGGGRRQVAWKIQSLRSVQQKLSEQGITFMVALGGDISPLVDLIRSEDIMACVTDFFPLRTPKAWNQQILGQTESAFFVVDSHNIVPTWVTSPKQEFGAYTIRPKIHKLVSTYCTEFPVLDLRVHAPWKPTKPVKNIVYFTPEVDQASLWEKIENEIQTDESIAPVDWLKPGEDAAQNQMKKFLEKILTDYTLRNDPNAGGLSDLSPYLHYGNISAQRIVLELIRTTGASWENLLGTDGAETPSVASSFFEELVVRKELADNYCYYNTDYDTPAGFPDWAKKSHEKHRLDKREFVYSLSEFEHAKTHDPLWNAAQSQMVKTGKMHGYMRMYWCKKILEWTPNVEIAQKIAITLNDRYELDGRDPNGYTGIAWSLGGVHDRAWFERDIFGQIRYMNAAGCARKFDTKQYIQRWSASTEFN